MRDRIDDDEWFDRVQKLREQHDGDGPDDRIRQIAREEADKRISAVAFMLGLWWVSKEYGREASYIVIALGVAYFIWTIVRLDWDPKHERHLIGLRADDLNRLAIIADAYAAGELVWKLFENEYPSDKRSIAAVESDRWDGSWKRIYDYILELQAMSPRQRRKRLMIAARRANPALEQGEAMSKQEDAELTFWARDYLHKLKQA